MYSIIPTENLQFAVTNRVQMMKAVWQAGLYMMMVRNAPASSINRGDEVHGKII